MPTMNDQIWWWKFGYSQVSRHHTREGGISHTHPDHTNIWDTSLIVLLFLLIIKWIFIYSVWSYLFISGNIKVISWSYIDQSKRSSSSYRHIMLAWYQNVNITWQAFACACIESLEVESKELETPEPKWGDNSGHGSLRTYFIYSTLSYGYTAALV